MDYPVAILPNEKYKFIEGDISKLYLVRHTPDKNVIDPNTNLISDRSVGSVEQMPDLSTSLLGVYQISHVLIQVINNDYIVYCEPDCNVTVPVFQQDFIIKNDRGFWAVEISKLDGQIVDYNISSQGFQAVCCVKHSPMKWNYWHFSIHWFVKNEERFWHQLTEDEKKARGWTKRTLVHETRSLIKQYGEVSIGRVPTLTIECYCKA